MIRSRSRLGLLFSPINVFSVNSFFFFKNRRIKLTLKGYALFPNTGIKSYLDVVSHYYNFRARYKFNLFMAYNSGGPYIPYPNHSNQTLLFKGLKGFTLAMRARVTFWILQTTGSFMLLWTTVNFFFENYSAKFFITIGKVWFNLWAFKAYRVLNLTPYFLNFKPRRDSKKLHFKKIINSKSLFTVQYRLVNKVELIKSLDMYLNQTSAISNIAYKRKVGLNNRHFGSVRDSLLFFNYIVFFFNTAVNIKEIYRILVYKVGYDGF